MIKHYEFDQDHLKNTPGYEFHGQIHDMLTAPGGYQRMEDFFVDLQIWGTPDQVKEKILYLQDNTYMDGYMGVFSYAGMAADEAERNARLFAAEVLPDLKALPAVHERLGVPV